MSKHDAFRRITDKEFVYVPADKTDVRKTFERIREQQKADVARDAETRLRKILQLRKGPR